MNEKNAGGVEAIKWRDGELFLLDQRHLPGTESYLHIESVAAASDAIKSMVVRGAPNRITRAFRDAVQVAYGAIGGDKAFATWARDNPTEFYRIAARLIPQEMRHGGNEGEPLVVKIMQFADQK